MNKRKRPTRLPRWQEWSVYASIGLLVVTGLLWLALDKWGQVEGDFGPESHPLQHPLIIAHGIASYAFLIVGGAMIPVHIKLGWHLKRHRGTGLGLALTCLFLAITGVILYYAGGEWLRENAALLHWIVGIGVGLLLIVHALKGRRG